MAVFGRKRFRQRQKHPTFNQLTSNVAFARSFGEGDGPVPRRQREVEAPAHAGLGTQWAPKSEQPRDKAPGPIH